MMAWLRRAWRYVIGGHGPRWHEYRPLTEEETAAINAHVEFHGNVARNTAYLINTDWVRVERLRREEILATFGEEWLGYWAEWDDGLLGGEAG